MRVRKAGRHATGMHGVRSTRVLVQYERITVAKPRPCTDKAFHSYGQRSTDLSILIGGAQDGGQGANEGADGTHDNECFVQHRGAPAQLVTVELHVARGREGTGDDERAESTNK